MDQQVFRRKNINLRNNLDQSDTLNINCRLANMNVSSSCSSADGCDESCESINHSSSHGRKSCEHIVQSKRSLSQSADEYERKSIAVKHQQDIHRKLSMSISREYYREVADSRDPEDDKHCESRLDIDERTEAISTLTPSSPLSPRGHDHQDVFTTPTISRVSLELESLDSVVPNDGNLWGSMNCLKRANPIYESDAEYEEREECTYQIAVRKRLCSMDRVTTAVYWHNELKTTDE